VKRPSFLLFALLAVIITASGCGGNNVAVPENVQPEPITNEFRSLGFDSANKGMESVLGLECSPLSCNVMAAEIRANEFCLFSGVNEAIAGAERFAVEQREPGHQYVVEVLERRGAAA
jgi:hypothetical protein